MLVMGEVVVAFQLCWHVNLGEVWGGCVGDAMPRLGLVGSKPFD